MSLLLLEGDLLNDWVVVITVIWKIVKRPRFLLCVDCEVVLELAISRAGGKASHKKKGPNFVEGLGEEGELSQRSWCPWWYPTYLRVARFSLSPS